MYFRVKKELKWDSKIYQRGDYIDLPEGHPRIEGLKIGGFISNDATSPNADEPEKLGTPVINQRKRK